MGINVKEYRDKWAYDISNNALTVGEITDEDVINQSIENILTTSYGDRLFNYSFGSPLPVTPFNSMLSDQSAEVVLDGIISAISKWEDRVNIIADDCRITILSSENAMILKIKYMIRNRNISSTFEKKLIF